MTLPSKTEKYCTNNKQQYFIRYRLEAYVVYSFGESSVVSIIFSTAVKHAQRLPAVSSELWYYIYLALERQQSFYSTDFSCFGEFKFQYSGLFFFFTLTYSRRTSSLPSCLWSQRIFPSLPGSHLTIFYRDASSALLQLVNQWLNFTYSRSHAFRYERRTQILLW